jgi:hypothetical protein
VAKTALCVISTPFGSPVVPLVYMIVHKSSLLPGVAFWGLEFPKDWVDDHVTIGTPYASADACTTQWSWFRTKTDLKSLEHLLGADLQTFRSGAKY